MTVEILPKFWAQFCETLDAQSDLLLDIRLQAEGDLQLIVQSAPLKSFSFDETSDACNNAVVVEFGSGSGLSEYRIVEPSRIILRKAPNGGHFNLMEMPAENGTVVISFHPGLNPAILRDLDLPQLAPRGA